jgi:hypothetical protein
VSTIPIRLRPTEVHIHADRRLAFEVITAFGARSQPSHGTSKVLERQGDQLLVEFHTPVRGLLGFRKVYRTVERVALRPPEAVEFEGVEGPIRLLRDRLVLADEGGCTRLRYESTIGLGWGPFGWLVGRLLVQPMMRKFMREHVVEVKETIEARAKKSRVYPQRTCALGESGGRHGR